MASVHWPLGCLLLDSSLDPVSWKACQSQTQTLTLLIVISTAQMSVFLAIKSLPAWHALQSCVQHLPAADKTNPIAIKAPQRLLCFAAL